MVSENTARLLWPGQDPIGKRIETGAPKPGEPYESGTFEVAGVAADVVSDPLSQSLDRTAVYFPARPGDPRNSGLVLRTRDVSTSMLAAVSRACSETEGVDGCEPVVMRDLLRMERLPFAIAGGVASGVGALALAMTSIGLYGVVAFAVAQRRREIGIRMALGARRSTVVVSVLAESGRRLAAGIALALPLCLAFSKLAASTFFIAQAHDPKAYAGAPLLLCAVGLAASLIPVRQAAAVDPVIALRQD